MPKHLGKILMAICLLIGVLAWQHLISFDVKQEEKAEVNAASPAVSQ